MNNSNYNHLQVSQANERSLNIKTLYQKMGQQVGQLEKENGELKAAFQVRI